MGKVECTDQSRIQCWDETTISSFFFFFLSKTVNFLPYFLILFHGHTENRKMFKH